MWQIILQLFAMLRRKAGADDTVVLAHHSDGKGEKDFIVARAIRRFTYHWHPERAPRTVEVFVTCDQQRTWFLGEFEAMDEAEAVDIYERVIKDCGFKELVRSPGS